MARVLTRPGAAMPSAAMSEEDYKGAGGLRPWTALFGRSIARCSRLRLQFLQLFFQEGQAGHRSAIGLVGDRVFLHLRPACFGILLIPRTPGLGIVRTLRGQVI